MKKYISILILSAIAFSFNAQTTWTVDNTTDSGADFSNLQTAIDTAEPGDTLQVHSSPTSYGNVTIDKTLYFIGTGHNPAANSDVEVATLGSITLKSNCQNTTINGLQIGSISIGTPIVNITDITIRNCRITSSINGNNNANVQDWLLEGNLFYFGTINPNLSYNWLVRNNIFYSNTYTFNNCNSSVTIANNLIIVTANILFNVSDGPTVDNNVFYVTGSATQIGFNTTTVSANNNLTYAGNGGVLSNFPGTGNLDNVDPEFINATNAGIGNFYTNNYHTELGSPVENAGTDGMDIGLYGGTFGYHQDGKPSDFPYMVSLSIQTPSIQAGELLNVIFSAQKNQ